MASASERAHVDCECQHGKRDDADDPDDERDGEKWRMLLITHVWTPERLPICNAEDRCGQQSVRVSALDEVVRRAVTYVGRQRWRS